MLEAVPREHNLQLYMRYAGMAELADALDSGSSEVTFVQVQVLLPAPKLNGHQTVSVFALRQQMRRTAAERSEAVSPVTRTNKMGASAPFLFFRISPPL